MRCSNWVIGGSIVYELLIAYTSIIKYASKGCIDKPECNIRIDISLDLSNVEEST
jgi:hypothetical protein